MTSIGYQQSFEFWNIPLNINMLLCSLMLFGALIQDLLQHGMRLEELPRWMIFPTAIGNIFTIIFPWNLLISIGLWQMIAGMGAPKSTTVMAIVLTLICWLLSLYAGFIRPVFDHR